MPIAKGKEEVYGKIVGRNIKKGKSLRKAKAIADDAVQQVDDRQTSSKQARKTKLSHRQR